MNDAADIAAFDARARADGYAEFLERDWAPGQVVPEHAHAFDARGLVTRGDMWLECGGHTRHLRVGDGFELAAGTPHAERYGAEGATFRVARRQPAS